MARRRSGGDDKKKQADRGAGFREFWSGTISFGLVSVPVELLPAERTDRVALREVTADGQPLRRRFFCPDHGRIVASDEIVRGYEYDPGKYVVVTDKELAALEPQKSREIDLREFVPIDEISPLFYQRSYYLAPGGDSTKAYRLLAHVLEQTQRAGIATFVMRDREYLVAIRGENGILRAESLRFVNEVRAVEDVLGALEEEPNARLVAQFARLINGRAEARLDPRALEDDRAAKLRALIDRKRKRNAGLVRVEPASEESAESDDEGGGEDLLEVIRRSLGGKGRAGAGAAGNGHVGNGRIKAANGKSNGTTAKAKAAPARAAKPAARKKAGGTTKRSASRRSGNRGSSAR